MTNHEIVKIAQLEKEIARLHDKYGNELQVKYLEIDVLKEIIKEKDAQLENMDDDEMLDYL
jgi:hypothetical protein